MESASIAVLIAAETGRDDGVFNDERELVTAIRDGDRSAAEKMVEKTYQTVFGSLFRLCGGDRDLTADLTQDTYRKAWQAIGQFNGNARLSTWLYRIAYTTFLNHVRGPHRVVSLDPEVSANIEDESPRADESLSRNEEAECLRRAVIDLPDDLRFTISAHYWGELDVRQIAKLEGVTTVAIRKRLRKAMGLLEAALAEGKP